MDFQIAMAEETEEIQLDKQVCTNGVRVVFNNVALGRYYVAEIAGKVVSPQL